MEYYYESDFRCGSFHAVDDTQAKEQFQQLKLERGDKLLCVYRESDTADGTPFIFIYNHRK